MYRYKVELAYNGHSFIGWQKQPVGESVQSQIEKALSTIFQKTIEVVGCGRTDSGVHASQYFLHFDGPELPNFFLDRLNKLVGLNIDLKEISKVDDSFHARFDAKERGYLYYLSGTKPIFNQQTRSFFPQFDKLNIEKMNEAAQLITKYAEFAPFCKTNSDAHTMKCTIGISEWELLEPQLLVYRITSNRFLRGMVRLIVGMCLNVGMGKMEIEEVIEALENQTPLNRSHSAPADGLFLNAVNY